MKSLQSYRVAALGVTLNQYKYMKSSNNLRDLQQENEKLKKLLAEAGKVVATIMKERDTYWDKYNTILEKQIVVLEANHTLDEKYGIWSQELHLLYRMN